MMNLLRSPTRWPISNREASQICMNLNSDAKKKTPNKNFRKNANLEAEMMEIGRKMGTSYGVLLIDPLAIEKQHKFA